MMIAYAKELRSKVPAALLGCQLLKVAINKLDRAKLTSFLKTAEAHSDIIVNLDEDQCSRMNYETASKKWTELAISMEWECKDFLCFIGGKGMICEPLKSMKAHLKPIRIEELQDNCPILLDTDWFQKLSELGNKKRNLSAVGWSDESLVIQLSLIHI